MDGLTVDDVIQVFEVFDLAGYPAPWRALPVPDQRGALLKRATVWRAILADLTPEQLHRAAHAWCRSGEAFWPRPGQLLARLPEANPAIGLPSAAEVFEWSLSVIGRRGWRGASLHSRATEAFGDAAAEPLRRALQAVGGTQALATAPIVGAGGAITRAALLRRWRDAWEASVERSQIGVDRQLGADWPASLMLGVDEGEKWMQ